MKPFAVMSMSNRSRDLEGGAVEGGAAIDGDSAAPPAPPPPPPPPPAGPGRRLIDQGSEEFRSVEAAREKLAELDKMSGDGRDIKMTIAWQIEEETNAS